MSAFSNDSSQQQTETVPRDTEYFENTIHASCNNCHHFHIGKLVKLPLNAHAYVRVPCEKCRKPLFAVGRTSTKSSMASEVTSGSFELYRSQYQSVENLSIAGSRRQSRTFAEPLQDITPSFANGSTVIDAASSLSNAPISSSDQDHKDETASKLGSLKTKRLTKWRKALRKLTRHGPFKAKEEPQLSQPKDSQPRPTMVDASTMTDLPLMKGTIGRALPSPRISTQKTIQEADEEDDLPLARISIDIFSDTNISESEQRAKQLHALRSEKTVKKQARLRLRYQVHCSTCRCADRVSIHEARVEPNDSLTTNGPHTQHSTPMSESPTTQGFVDRAIPPSFMGDHLIRPASPSSYSERSFSSAISSAVTLLERRSSIASRRTNSLPAGAYEFMSFASQMRPGALEALRNYDEAQVARHSEDGTSSAHLSASFGSQSSHRDRLRGRSPLRNILVAPAEEDSDPGDPLSYVGAHSNEDASTPRQSAQGHAGQHEPEQMDLDLAELEVTEDAAVPRR